MTTCYTLTERNDQLLLAKVCWRPLAIIDPAREEKRKEWEKAMIATYEIALAGKPKLCLVYDRLDPYNDECSTPAEERSTLAAACAER